MADRAEYERVAREALPYLYKTAVSILRSDADARDAVQQALLKGWEKKENAQPGKFHWYLTRILINECRSIQRHRMRVFPVEAPPARARLSPDYQELYAAIDSLEDKLKLPLLLKYLQGNSRVAVCMEAEGRPVWKVTLKVRGGYVFAQLDARTGEALFTDTERSGVYALWRQYVTEEYWRENQPVPESAGRPCVFVTFLRVSCRKGWARAGKCDILSLDGIGRGQAP